MTPEELKKIRHDMWLTQKQMAELLGVTLRSYWGYEAGDRKIPKSVGIILELTNRLKEKE